MPNEMINSENPQISGKNNFHKIMYLVLESNQMNGMLENV